MLDKNFVESFLRVNDASKSMSDTEVRTILGKAGWSESEVSAAVTLLRSESTPKIGADDTHLPFRPGMEFSSSQLSQLLGVDVVIDPGRLSEGQGAIREKTFSIQQVLSIIGVISLATGLAIGAGIFSAFLLEIGPFHA